MRPAGGVAGRLQGLTASEAAARRARGLGNNVRLGTSRSYAQIIRENAFTFINTVLFAIGAVLIAMGSVQDAIVTAGLVLLNVIVGVVQEGRAKRKLDHIALLTRPKATVIREGSEKAVDPAEIVAGDLLVARPGDQIVVDGEVRGDGRMAVDESLLTGESDQVAKAAGDTVYSGSFCVSGSAVYEAQKVGADSLANRLTAQARRFRRIKTPLQHDIDFVIRMMVLLAAQLGLLLGLSALLKHTPMVDLIQVAAVIVVLVPQGLFFMTTVTYASGAVRMAGKGALVQQSNAIESMSNVDVLCLDKTGTLTANRLLLAEVCPARGEPGLDELRRILGDFAASLSERNRTADAIAAACPGTARAVAEDVPFSSEWKWSAVRFGERGRVSPGASRDTGGGTYVLGAPEVLLPCLESDKRERAQMEAQIGAWADMGRRVLLFAETARDGEGPLNPGARAPLLPAPLRPLGVLALTDELRPEAGATLQGFRDAGIALKIISGDSPETVAALARQAGFAGGGPAISGQELAAMTPEELAQAAEEHGIFGRITPQQKEKLVGSLRAGGHYVAMIGDGVNDVLSLKQAQLGIAMETGSQAARGVADIILLGDSFGALPAAFREGQRILRGMQDVIRLFLARTLYVTMLILGAAIVGATFPLTPKHNAILALLTVGVPTLFLATWAKPGRPTGLGQYAGRQISILRSVRHFVFPAAFTVAALALAVYLGYVFTGRSLHDARSAMTTAMILCGVALIVFVEPPAPVLAAGDDLTDDRRPAALAFAMLAAFAGIMLLAGPRQFFALAPLPPADLAIIVAGVAAWAVALLYIWRHNLFERLLELTD